MKTLRLAVAAIAATGLLAAPVLGQQSKPTPGCAGVYNDRKGDAEPENLDITGFWFKTEAGRVTANLRIANLTKDIPSDSTGVNWYILWNFDDAQRFVSASIDVGSDVEFSYGSVDGDIRSGEGETAGQFVEGEEGVISLTVPPDIGGSSGVTLGAPIADTQTAVGIPGVVSALSEVDAASGRSYKVNECESAAGQPSPEPSPSPSPSPSPEPSPGGSGQTVERNKLDLRLTGKAPRARKVKRRLALKVRSSKGVTDVDAALYRGSIRSNRVVAKGSARRIRAGKSSLRLRVSKKLKKGSYTLYVVGRNADGTSADRRFKLRLR